MTTSTAQQLVELGCSAADVVTQEGRYYAVCGKSAVWVLERAEAGRLGVIARHHVGGAVRAVFVRDGQVWVVSVRESAQPLDDTPREAGEGPPVSAASVPRPSAPPPHEPGDFGVPGGRVISVHEQQVVVSLGAEQGLRLGDHVELYALPGDELSAPATEPRSLVGRVVAVAQQKASLALGFAEFPEAGMLARRTDRPLSASRLSPRRLGKLLILDASFRPFLPIEELGFALLGDLTVTYLPPRDMYVRFELRPIGALWQRGLGDTGLFGAYTSAGYDQTLFALGLGLGLLTMRDPIEVYTSEVGYTSAPGYSYEQRSGVRFAVLQHVRLGSRDGLHFTSSSAVRLGAQSWEFGWLDGAIQIPVNARSWIVLRCSGGIDPGHVTSELGIRRLLHGNGAGGSLFLRPTAGLAGIEAARAFGDFVLGPMVGLHLEGRLAR